MYSAMYLYNLFNDALFLPETAAQRRKALNKALTLSALPSDPSRFGRCFSSPAFAFTDEPSFTTSSSDTSTTWWWNSAQPNDPAAHVRDPFLDDPTTVQLATGVSFLRAAQLAVEAVANVSSRNRARSAASREFFVTSAVLGVEVVKFLLRLGILWRRWATQGSCMLTEDSIPSYVPDEEEKDSSVQQKSPDADTSRACRPTLLTSLWQLLPEDERKRKPDFVASLLAGEILHLIRPLVYLLAALRFGRNSWKPFLMSLGVDLLSRRASGSGRTAEEKQEASKRLWALLLYLLRPPFCNKVLIRVLHAICGKVMPCLPQIPNAIVGILESYSNSYFYISGT